MNARTLEELIKNSYLPEEIQEMIDNNGVKSMVREVNQFMSSTYKHNVLVLSHVDGRKAVIDSDNPST